MRIVEHGAVTKIIVEVISCTKMYVISRIRTARIISSAVEGDLHSYYKVNFKEMLVPASPYLKDAYSSGH